MYSLSEPLFFALPLELREHIYQYVMLGSKGNPQLPRVSHQLHSESQKFLYKRPQSFESQAALQAWIELVGTVNLQYVTSLTFQLQDVNFRSVLSSSVAQLPPKVQGPTLYKSEREAILSALSGFRNLRCLTIHRPPLLQSYLYRSLYQACLDTLGHYFPKLQDISFYSDEQSLTFLEHLSNLRSIRFTGFSVTSPSETLKVLNSLSSLTTLELIDSSPTLMLGGHGSSNSIGRRQSFDGHTLRCVRPLSKLCIRETISQYRKGPIFISPSFLSALDAHSKTLRILRITTDYTPTGETRVVLQRFLSSSNVRELELDWTEPSSTALISNLPRSISSLTISTDSLSGSAELLREIQESKEQLRILTNLQLLLYPTNVDVNTEAKSFPDFESHSAGIDAAGPAIAALEALGVTVDIQNRKRTAGLMDKQ
ncbi:hypothetical protein M501DRAFT_81557 [Patellaria atrata CBS 101060]|uniref:Uncharacterized protein n=1 Tax=Patellaria atrata CBS 101060 TaxID=1346257 RepID=A0A9P4VRV5_9PEZI|nr:hypothetical protein M501DRAFT_81557 [Patellaria atrata CBS 101060]